MRNPNGKRLFKVIVGNRSIYFDNKAAAKVERDLMTAEGYTDIVVNRGPDHHKGETGS